MGVNIVNHKILEVILTNSNNQTLTGVLNFTTVDLGQYTEEEEIYDSKGAATFVVVVILVYGSEFFLHARRNVLYLCRIHADNLKDV